MSQTVDYPMNIYSRAITDTSGPVPSYIYLLCHADRATVSSGTWFVDHSSFDNNIVSAGSAIIQTTAAAYFSAGGVQFTGNTGTNYHLAWHGTFTNAAATGTALQFVFDNFVNFDSISSTGDVWWRLQNSTAGIQRYSVAYFILPSSGQHKVYVNFWAQALGHFFSREYEISTFSTGSWMHFALVRDSATRIACFQNGSQLPLVTAASHENVIPISSTTNDSGSWATCPFHHGEGQVFTYGGLYDSGDGSGSFFPFSGKMDEFRIAMETTNGLGFNTLGSIWFFNVPSAPYEPADGTFNITQQILSIGSVTMQPGSGVSEVYHLGSSGTQFGDLWIAGTAYIDQIGEDMLFVGSFNLQFRNSTTYIFSSGTGYITISAGTQITLSASTIVVSGHVSMSAKNFLIDTATGVTFATATNQKIAFYGSTPIVQPSGNILTALENLGLVSNPSILGLTYSVTTTSANYTLTTGDDYLICNSGTNFNVTLPAAIGSYQEFMIKNINTGTVTVQCNSADEIDGAASFTLDQWQKSRVFDFIGVTYTPGTADVLAAGTASADDEGTGQEADKAFDDNTGTEWWSTLTNPFPHWIMYDLGSGTTSLVVKMSIKPYSNINGVGVKDFSFWGTNSASPDGSNDAHFTELYSGTHANDTAVENYTFSNATAYRYLRWKITSNWRGTFNDAIITELQAFEGTPVAGQWLTIV